MSLQTVVPNFINDFFAFCRRYNKYITAYGESSMECDRLEEDCISEMPDEILNLILPYLTVKDAFKTRILSRRWRHLYLWYPHASRSNLKFDSNTMFNMKCGKCNEYEVNTICQRYPNAFVQKVNKFLNEYKGPNFGSFRVTFRLDRKFALDIDRWINFAIKMGAENIQLNLYCFCDCIDAAPVLRSKLYSFSFRLLSEASNLKYLGLHSCILEPDFNGQFHSLKFLDLNVITINQSLLLYILSRCSNLEQLKLSQCLCPMVLSVRSPFLRLKQLMIYDCEGLEEIELSASHLTNFEYFSFSKTANLEFSSVRNLEKAHFVLTRTVNISYFFNKLANHLPQLQSLSLDCSSIMIMSIPRFTCTFGNLKQLEFSVFGSSYYDIRKIIPILSVFPVLQKFNLMIRYIGLLPIVTQLHDYEVRMSSVFDKCIHTQLKEVEISGFHGTVNQLELAAYILENAVALEKMVLTSCVKQYRGFGVWREEISPLKLPFDERKCQRIVELLERKATSKAQVIVEKII